MLLAFQVLQLILSMASSFLFIVKPHVDPEDCNIYV